MLRDALSTPVRTRDAATTLLIGGVLVFGAALGPAGLALALSGVPVGLVGLPLAVLPALVLRGYYLRVVAAGVAGDPAAPSLVGWGGLLRDGVRSAVLTVGYLLPGVVLLVGTLLVAGLLAPAPPTDPSAVDPGTVAPAPGDGVRALATLAVLALGGLLLLCYGLAYLYLRPAALVVLATTEGVRPAFGPRAVGRVAGSRGFAVGWLLAAVVLVVGALVAVPLSVVLVGFVGLVYLQVVAHSLFGRGAATVLADSPDAGPAEPTTPLPRGDRPATAGGVSAAVQTGRSVPLRSGGDVSREPDGTPADHPRATDDPPSTDDDDLRAGDGDHPRATDDPPAGDGNDRRDGDRSPEGPDPFRWGRTEE
jgi:hypothetical protein